MVNIKLLAFVTVAGWLAVLTGQITGLLPIQDPQHEVAP